MNSPGTSPGVSADDIPESAKMRRAGMTELGLIDSY